MTENSLNAVVSQRVEVAPGLCILRVVPDAWPDNEFKPGQFVLLGLPGTAERCPMSEPEDEPPKPGKLIIRAYSIASSSVHREYLEFYLTLVRSGALTPRLFNLKIGDRLYISPKYSGFFTLDEVPADANLILVATGTGLAPYMSMVRTQLVNRVRQRTAVIHGARNSWDLGYRAELIMMERFCPGFSYLPIISEPDKEPVRWGGHVGFIQDLWRAGAVEKIWGAPPTPQDTHVFLCGNPKMIEAMSELLEAQGFKRHSRKNPGQYHVEEYW